MNPVSWDRWIRRHTVCGCTYVMGGIEILFGNVNELAFAPADMPVVDVIAIHKIESG